MIFTERYTKVQEAYLKRLDEIQSVLDIVCLQMDGNTENIYEVSKEALVEAMKIFENRLSEYFKRRFPNKDRYNYFQIELLPSPEPKGELIRFDVFIGQSFDFKKDKVNVTSYNHGLAYALLNPPYGLQNTGIEGKLNTLKYLKSKQEVFTKLLTEFLTKMLDIQDIQKADKMIIYKWSDDWSNYFDAGKEWWGTYCWTIYNPYNNIITVITGSSTD